MLFKHVSKIKPLHILRQMKEKEIQMITKIKSHDYIKVGLKTKENKVISDFSFSHNVAVDPWVLFLKLFKLSYSRSTLIWSPCHRGKHSAVLERLVLLLSPHYKPFLRVMTGFPLLSE